MSNIQSSTTNELKTEMITVNSEIFDNFRENFNCLLANCIKQMDAKHSDESEIKVSFKISLSPMMSVDDNKEYRPTIKHKIDSTIQTKSKLSGEKTGYILSIDEYGNVIYQKDNSQVSIDDIEDMEDEPIRELPSGEPKALLEEQQGPIDVDFDEV